jgi:hypothetical protein
MASKKITEQDMKTGKIYRCANCEIKCDDEFELALQTYTCGQVQKTEISYCCSRDCIDFINRERNVFQYKKRIEFNNGKLRLLTEMMKITIECKMKLTGLFDCIKMYKADNKAVNLLISREATSAEIIVAFNKVRDYALTMSEIVESDEIKDATGEEAEIYGYVYPTYLTLCALMRASTETMEYSEHELFCVD